MAGNLSTGEIGEIVSNCHSPNCSWLSLSNLTGLPDVPPLLPNPDVSGIGVILGSSISAYLTLVLLILHYITVHDVRRTNSKGKVYINPVDHGVLTFIRERIVSWSPSKRFKYAMEKSVLILSDLNLITGIGILIAGYSQLECGISAYHWQIEVFVAWFASFSFLSAMAFLEGYLQTNKNMRIIRVFFMFVLASLLISALLPTGSKMWLNLYLEDGAGFYPSLSTACFYKELTTGSFLRRGPKIWSMIFSIAIIVVSNIHCGVRLFDPTAEASRKYFRIWPGSKLKQSLRFLERKALPGGIQARLWGVLYLLLYVGFTSSRAFYDISESMLSEILWLTFAIAWGTVKVWKTRAMASYNYDGANVIFTNSDLGENSWSFGQILPLILLLLPLLSMAQAYLDNDAKAQEANNEGEEFEETTLEKGRPSTSAQTGNIMNEGLSVRCNSTSCSTARTRTNTSDGTLSTTRQCFTSDTAAPLHPRSPPLSGFLPQYPYSRFTSYPWYNDHILFLLCQILMITAFALWVLTELANVFGIAAILRNRIFLIWILAIGPLACFVHLAAWYLAALLVSRLQGAEAWLKGQGTSRRDDGKFWRRVTIGKVVYWMLRLGLVGGCLVFTFCVSLELAGPGPL